MYRFSIPQHGLKTEGLSVDVLRIQMRNKARAPTLASCIIHTFSVVKSRIDDHEVQFDLRLFPDLSIDFPPDVPSLTFAILFFIVILLD